MSQEMRPGEERRKAVRAGRRVRGFTLLELLTVMAIMGIVMGAGIASFVQMRRGWEIRGAEAVIRSTLALSRQHAVTKRRSTIVVFRQNTTNAMIYVFEQGGKADGLDRIQMYDAEADWAGISHSNKWICNMRDGSLGKVATHDVETLRLVSPGLELNGAASTWRAQDAYGWQINETASLPPGIVITPMPDPIVFKPSGQATGSPELTVRFREKLNPASTRTLTLYTLTGLMATSD